MNKDQPTQIDPEEFAFRFAETARRMNYEDKELIPEAKKFLLSYLTAHYLIDDFNKLEAKEFTNGKKLNDLSFEEMIDHIQKLNSSQMFKG